VEEARQRIEQTDRRAFTPNTKTSPAELMEELARVRYQGFAVIDQELELGLCSIAVPLHDERGQVVAALNIGAPAAQIPASELVARFLVPLQSLALILRPMLR
jgi:IclR family pca regulon transcriptional regulator